jgi:predicted nucleotidyltransferase
MKTVPATELRRNLFATLKRLAYEKNPILIERRGKAIAALVVPESLGQPPAAPPTRQPRSARPLIDPKALGDFCARHAIKTLYLFGSVLTDRFDTDSDIDVMFEPEGPAPGYFEQMNMSDELAELFGHPVDLVSRSAIESSTNRFRKQAILAGARVVFAR